VSKLAGVAVAISVVVLFGCPAPAYAACGDIGEGPCIGPVPTIDQVVAIMAELTDPHKPAADKGDIVAPAFSPGEAGMIDNHLRRMDAVHIVPLLFVVTNIQPAANNFAGATLATTGSFHQVSAAKPIVLVNQHDRWYITHDTATTALNAFWYNARRDDSGPADADA
jgi:hypothetical protein